MKYSYPMIKIEIYIIIFFYLLVEFIVMLVLNVFFPNVIAAACRMWLESVENTLGTQNTCIHKVHTAIVL